MIPIGPCPCPCHNENLYHFLVRLREIKLKLNAACSWSSSSAQTELAHRHPWSKQSQSPSCRLTHTTKILWSPRTSSLLPMSYGTLIDPQLPVTRQVDASAAGVGGALLQDNQPVAFYF